MYKCFDCGCVFEGNEADHWEDSHGLEWGHEDFYGCPECGGGFEEAKECAFCGEYILPEENYGGLCIGCIEEHKYDYETALKIGNRWESDISINAFLATQFSAEEINDLLEKELRRIAENGHKIDCSRFINDDIEEFAQELINLEEKKER